VPQDASLICADRSNLDVRHLDQRSGCRTTLPVSVSDPIAR
jgi:hypothetical protein